MDGVDERLFRGGRWHVDLSEQDAKKHLFSIGLNQDIQLVMNYLVYFLLVDTSKLGDNEFSERHQDIKDGITHIINKRYDSGARQLGPIIEGIVKKTILRDGCIDNATPYPNWIGKFHEHPQPRTFYQFLEGALSDPRSRIGRTIFYPPSEEIHHVSEMIRNPLAHGSQTLAILDDYKVLFYILILLFHDIVNPDGYRGDDKYLIWVYRASRNLRLSGDEPTLEKLSEIAKEQGLDLAKIKAGFDQMKAQ
jgi:hypothetical protein